LITARPLTHRLKERLMGCLTLMMFSCIAAGAQGTGSIIGLRAPVIKPDYTHTTFPPNIAPPNFRILEKGKAFRVRISGESGPDIRISGKSPKIILPAKSWKRLARECAGRDIFFEIEAQNGSGEWTRFAPIVNHIAGEPVDPYLYYRLIHPAYNLYHEMGIYQRNLENNGEKPILLNRTTDHSCMNCHNFCMNDPERWMMHLRGGEANGTLIVRDGEVRKVNTATDFNKAGAYPSWHPDGRRIVFSVNTLKLFYHAAGEPRDVLDEASDLIVYEIESNRVTSSPLIADPKRMENFPCWSPDGKSLFFCSAPDFETFSKGENSGENPEYDRIRYDLMRVSYDPESGQWHDIETVFSASETGLSAAMPRVSPDGRFLLFCTTAYGNFPVYRKDSDLVLMDLKTRRVVKPDINSSEAETFHSWSSNSRWFVFSSKRIDGVCARPFFSYLDEDGRARKPFVLPQRDPDFYDTFIPTYNVPELARGPVRQSPWTLTGAALNNEKKLNAGLDPAWKSKTGKKAAEDKLYQQAPR